MAALKAAIEGDGFTAGDYATLKDIQAALVILEGDDTVAGSVLADIKAAVGTWPTYDPVTNTFGTNGTGIYQAVADKIDQNAAALKAAIEGDGFTAGDYATLKDIQAALVILEGDDTVAGSVLADIKTVALTPTLSIVGTDLADSTLDSSEGDLVVRVSLPTAASADDVVELLLGGGAFGTAKTDTLSAGEVSAGYVDFTVTRSDLGDAGVKGLTAKITSGAVIGNASAGLFFTLAAADTTAPTAPVLDTIASDNLINKAEHDGVTWISGTAESNSQIKIEFLELDVIESALTRYVRADEFGNWQLPYTANRLPADGTYTIKVTSTDADNNATSTQRTGVVIDSAVPIAPVISTVAGDNVIDALENSDGFTISGTGDAGATITLVLSSGHTLAGGNTTTVSEGGTWSLEVDEKEAGQSLRLGEELLTVYQTDAVGNVSPSTHRLIDVITTLLASGDLSVQDLSGLSRLELSGNLMALPSQPSWLPQAIDAKGYSITAGAPVNLTAVTLSNLGDLFVDDDVTLTMSASQASAFNAGGTINLNATGVVSVTASGNLAAFDLENVSLALNGATTLPSDDSRLPKALNTGANAVTVTGTIDLSAVALTVAANASFTVAGGGTLTVTPEQAGAIAGVMSAVLTASLHPGSLASFAGLSTGPADVITITVNDLASETLGASALSGLGGKTAGTVTVSNSVTISGSAAEVTAALVTEATKVVAATATVAINDANDTALNATELSSIGGATSGTVTVANAVAISGSAAEVTAALVTEATKVVAATATVAINDANDAALNATELSAIGGATSGTVTVANAVAISGSAAEVTAALVTADTLLVAGSAKVTVTDPISVAAANAIAAKTSGVVTATLTTGNLASFSALEETGNAYTVTVNDANTETLLASALSTLGGKTTGTVTVSNAVTISGTVSELTAALVTTDTKVMTDFANLVASNSGTVTAASLVALDGTTSGFITATSVNTLTGTAAEVRGVTNNLAVGYRMIGCCKIGVHCSWDARS